jgi:hypothetical protein
MCLAAATLTRPEGLGYALALVAATAVVDRRRAARTAAVVALVFVPYFIWHWLHFGHPLPNTFYAKVGGTAALWRGVIGLEEYLSSQLAWLLIAAALWAVVTRWRQGWVRLHAAVIAAAAANVVLVGGHTFAFHRFMLPALAPLLVLTGVAMGDVAKALRRSSPHGVQWAAGGVAVLAAWMLVATVRLPIAALSAQDLAPRNGVMRAARLNHGYRAIGQWLGRTMPKDAVVAVNAAGIIPYESGLPTIDMLGLNDAHIAHREVAMGRGAIGHEKHDGAYVLSRQPDVVLLGLPQFTDGPLRTGEQLRAQVQVFFATLPGDKKIFLDPGFRTDYAPRSVEVLPGKWLTLFIRKDRLAALGQI